MPLAPLPITDELEKDLRLLAAQPTSQIEAAYNRASAMNEPVISPKPLRVTIGDALSPEVVRALIEQLIGLRSYIDFTNVEPSEALASLSLSLKERGWSEEEQSRWEKLSQVFERFLALENLMTIAKALELSLDFEHVLIDAKILTDIRLVYSGTRDKIIGGIICNRLRIKMHDEDTDKSLSISIDKDQIEHLQKLCSDALNKTKMASNMLDKAGLRYFITGEGYDDFA